VTESQSNPTSSVRFGQSSGGEGRSAGFGARGAFIGLALIAGVLGGLAWAAVGARSEPAQRPQLFGGSLVLEDTHPLAVLDLATAQVTVRLQGVDSEVGSADYSNIQVVPVPEGTMLVNRISGTFNMLGKDDYLVDAAGAGVGLGRLQGGSHAAAVASGRAAFIVRFAPRSTVSLVDQTTVAAAARLEAAATGRDVGSPAGQRGRAGPAAVAPRGFAALPGRVPFQPGSDATSGGDLWVLVQVPSGCQLEELRPVSPARLVPAVRTTIPGGCASAAVEGQPGSVAVASPGHVRLFEPGGPVRGVDVPVPQMAAADRFLPVTGPERGVSFLARTASGWWLFSVTPSDRLIGPSRLDEFGPSAEPVVPAISEGALYSLDGASTGQPALWSIDPATGSMHPIPGVANYPQFNATERPSFNSAEVISDGPRVVFNNPSSLDAVVVFTDHSHPAVVVVKSDAVTVSATGPAAFGGQGGAQRGRRKTGSSSNTPNRGLPVVQPISQQIACATTTQKPYSPQITSVNPTSASVMISWSYALLDQTDCEPDSWSVHVIALTGGHQPGQPTQTVAGQGQYLFNGLRPATTYQAVVTAYINHQSTPSTPVTFTTSPRGPDAPASVTTTSDGKGDWVVSWTRCVSAGCVVPADRWTVIGSACGTSFIGQPPMIQVPGRQSSITINADSLGLLGEEASFSIEGSLFSGLTGRATSDNSCTEAWRPPNPSAITLASDGATSGTDTFTATLQVEWTGSRAEAFGSQSTLFVYSVGGHSVGPTAETTVEVPGLADGEEYTATVTVTPVGHPAARTDITGRPFTRTIGWPPDLGVSVNGTVDSNPNFGTLAVNFSNLPPGSMAAQGDVQCGGSGGSEFAFNGEKLVAGAFTISNFNLDTMGGDCTLTATLSDTDNPNPYGGVSSKELTTAFTIGTQPAYAFSSAWGTPTCLDALCLSQQYPISVCFGSTCPSPSSSPQPAAGIEWGVQATGTVLGARDDSCTVTAPTTSDPAFPVLLVESGACKHLNSVTVTVSWTYLGATRSAVAPFTGNPPPPPKSTTTTTTTCAGSTGSTSTTTCPPGRAAQAPKAARSPANAATTPTGARGSGDAIVRAALGSSVVVVSAFPVVGGARRLVRTRRTDKRR
jgi:Fibronectin type III domain